MGRAVRAAMKRPRSLAYYAAVTDIEPSTCTVLEVFTNRQAAERAIAGVQGAAVFDARARLPMGARVSHAAGVCWLINYAEGVR
jgi:hypothetical protein